MLASLESFIWRGFHRLIPRLNQSFERQNPAAPSVQGTLDIFKGKWASSLPHPFRDVQAGPMPLFDDKRLKWGLGELGSITGFHILELGPLEAGHTYTLCQAGAGTVTALESNAEAYLKCLVIKDLLHLDKAELLYGNCIPYLQTCTQKFDLCVSSGILYHMENPAELIELISKVSDRLFLWTHYYSAKMQGDPRFRHFDHNGLESTHRGFSHKLHRQNYGRSLFGNTFWGGTKSFSSWMSRDDILRCLGFYGFVKVAIGPEEQLGPNGPSFTLVASK